MPNGRGYGSYPTPLRWLRRSPAGSSRGNKPSQSLVSAPEARSLTHYAPASARETIWTAPRYLYWGQAPDPFLHRCYPRPLWGADEYYGDGTHQSQDYGQS